jgi:hypothetical protein
MNEKLAAERYEGSNQTLTKNTVSEYLEHDAGNIVFDPSTDDWNALEQEIFTSVDRVRNREPFDSPDGFAPVNDIYDLDSNADSAELKWMQSQPYETDLRGLDLSPEEEKDALTALRSVEDRNDRSSRAVNEPSPLQERLIQTIAYSPSVSKDAQDKLVDDSRAMSTGASIVVNSPYVSDEIKERAFNTAPSAALESPVLDGKLVNQMFTDDNPYTRNGKGTPDAAVAKALHNPNADPQVAYDYLKNRSDTDAGYDAMRWQISLNPNDDFINEVKRLDAADHGGENSIIVDDPSKDDEPEWSSYMDS